MNGVQAMIFGSRALMLASLMGLASITRAEESPVSKYTSTEREKSVSFRDVRSEPGGGFEGVFSGLGGYQLIHLAGDDRSWINVRHGNETIDLYAATMEWGPGSFPHKANDVVEWRGLEKDGRFEPYAIIYRIAGSDETGRVTKTRLVVIKLDKERSAIIGYTEGENEDAAAKLLADIAGPR